MRSRTQMPTLIASLKSQSFRDSAHLKRNRGELKCKISLVRPGSRPSQTFSSPSSLLLPPLSEFKEFRRSRFCAASSFNLIPSEAENRIRGRRSAAQRGAAPSGPAVTTTTSMNGGRGGKRLSISSRHRGRRECRIS